MAVRLLLPAQNSGPEGLNFQLMRRAAMPRLRFVRPDQPFWRTRLTCFREIGSSSPNFIALFLMSSVCGSIYQGEKGSVSVLFELGLFGTSVTCNTAQAHPNHAKGLLDSVLHA